MEEIYAYLEQFQGESVEVHLVGALTKFFVVEMASIWIDEQYLVLGTEGEEKRFSVKINDIQSYRINTDGKMVIDIGKSGLQQIWIGLARD